MARPRFKLPGASGPSVYQPVTSISAISAIVCRLTADGKLKPCLLQETEIDLREPLRAGASQSELKDLVQAAILAKPAGHQLVEGDGHQGRPFSHIGG
jgi:cyclic pyranopterin phosphate synthase